MGKPKPTEILAFISLVAPVAFLALGAWLWSIQVQRDLAQMENAQLRERVETQAACAPVHVVCECPSYGAGWDDAEHLGGCDYDRGIDTDEFQFMCSEFWEFEYSPGP